MQFGHPSVNKLFKLVDDARLKNYKHLKIEMKNISDSCEICDIYRKPVSRSIV